MNCGQERGNQRDQSFTSLFLPPPSAYKRIHFLSPNTSHKINLPRGTIAVCSKRPRNSFLFPVLPFPRIRARRHHHQDLREESSPPDRWDCEAQMGLPGWNREAKASCGDTAEPGTSRLLPDPDPTLLTRAGTQPRQEKDEGMP